jgi:tetraacyldisaccharide 4'-kinase
VSGLAVRLRPELLWYGRTPPARAVSAALAPLGWLYCAVAALRGLAYRRGWLDSESAGVPVVVVGNLTVGGTGKTPLVLWLVAHLQRRGLRPGVAMRGYGGSGRDAPRRVRADSDPFEFGDEPVLLAGRAGCPVVVGRDRVAAARMLALEYSCDIVVTDDGLQHYRLRRDCEILVVDGMRGFGNGRCLPAGPLREPRGRAARSDLVIVNAGDGSGDGLHAGPGGDRRAAVAADDGPAMMCMALVPGDAVNLYHAGERRALETFRGERVTAVAGIGNPERFFAMLRNLGLDPATQVFPDHHRYSGSDLAGLPAGPVLMTEKDAVKCRAWATAEHWYVPVQARPDTAFVAALESIVDGGLVDRLRGGGAR